jgi:hypothetical protein
MKRSFQSCIMSCLFTWGMCESKAEGLLDRGNVHGPSSWSKTDLQSEETALSDSDAHFEPRRRPFANDFLWPSGFEVANHDMAILHSDSGESSRSLAQVESLHEVGYIRERKPLTVAAGLAVTTSVIPSFGVGYTVSQSLELNASVVAVGVILGYNARGFAGNLRYYLLPRQNYSPFVAVGAGPLWREEQTGKYTFGGAIASAQFGWDYTFDSGFGASLAVGPILSFVKHEQVNGAAVQVSLGWRF